MTGRAVSAAIHSRLRELLLRGEAQTYAQLAEHAGCTVRSVRNYLSRSKEIFGFEIDQHREPGNHSVMVRAKGVADSQPAVSNSAPLMTAALRERLFHLEPSRLSGVRPSPFLVALRGFPSYSAEHERLLEAWLNACSQNPPRAVRLRRVRERGAPEALLWPLAAVLHNIQGLLLVGLPLEADSVDALQVMNLENVSLEAEALELIDPAVTGEPALDLASLELPEILDLPFSWRPLAQSSRAAVRVHVRFDPSLAERLRSRFWHRSQTAVLRTDGSLDVKFGPVDLDVAAGWASSFGSSVQVLGDKKLRKAVKKRSFSP